MDSRPSDALALAVRAGVRIFASEAVLTRAPVEPESRSVESLETTGEASADPRLEVFRDFVNSLEVDVEGETKEGPAPNE